MAPNSRPGGSSEAPAGQPASGQITAEVNIDPGDVTGPSPVVGPDATVVSPGPRPLRRSDENVPADQAGGPAAGGRNGPAATSGDGWDADSTVSWDTSSAWEDEDTEGPDNGVERWDDAPNWEGEVVVWEGQGAEVVPTPAGPGGWSGAPTYPPAYVPAHLPSSPGSREDAMVPYAGGAHLAAAPGAYDRKTGPRTRRETGPWRELVIVTAVAVIVSAVILAVTTAEKNNLGGLDSLFGSPTTTAAAPPSSLAAGVATGGAASHSAASSGPVVISTTAPKNATPTLSQRATSLPVTAGVAQSLVSSWLATNPGGYGIGAPDVAGTVPNELYYAVQRATGTYWALAAFKPSAALSAQSGTPTGQAELAEFHDSVYAFSWQAGPVWTLLGEFSTGSCPDVWVPRAVLAAWGLCGL
jgi:hypothetical protein